MNESSWISALNLTQSTDISLVNVIAANITTTTTTRSLMQLIGVNRSFGGDFNKNHEDTNIVFLVITSVALICLILATIIGNLFVIGAIICERTLRTVGNYLVLSLAVTDLLVACLVMPIGAIYEVTQEWRLGTNLCEIWTFVDVLCCTASIFHLLAIALDRFYTVTTIDYVYRRKSKHVCIGICIIWILSAVISLGPMLGWKDENFRNRIVEQKECLVSQDLGYQLFATIFAFYAPSILLIFVHFRIYQVAKARILLKKQRCKHRIRRRPSFYRQRQSESEIRELPSVVSCQISHRSSINPTDENYSSSAVHGTTSSSGVFSSSTTTTTIELTSNASSCSLSPPAIISRDALPSNKINRRKWQSIQHFDAYPQQRHKKRRKSEAICDKRNSKQMNESTSIFVAVRPPRSNIMVFVDDTACGYFAKTEPQANENNVHSDDENANDSLRKSSAVLHFKIDESPEETNINDNKIDICGTRDNDIAMIGKRKAQRNDSQTKISKANGKRKIHFRNKITQYESNESKQESKAAKTLTIITGIFIACWLPFFLLAVITPLCKECINKYFFEFCLWLGWANSSVNPFLYTIFSPDFRSAFKKFIFGYKKRMKKRK